MMQFLNMVATSSHNPCACLVGACSVERWQLSYDRNLHEREVQSAVEAMDAWRTELLMLTAD